MKGFEPNLLDKLFDEQPCVTDVSAVLRRLSLDELKESVARDVESLLNTRIAMNETALSSLEHCKRSAMTYGLQDFAGRSLLSFDDRNFICRCIENALIRHESRLQNIHVGLRAEMRSTNALYFSISALLVVNPAREPVNFDALLQPSNLRYSVRKARNLGKN